MQRGHTRGVVEAANEPAGHDPTRSGESLCVHDENPVGQGKMLLEEPAGSHEDIPSAEVNPLGQGMQGVEAPRLLPKE